MAIKVNNTTVIDDSRNITNIATATATSFVGDGSGLTNLPVAEGGTITATASGTLPNGAPVVVNSNGTVSAVSGTGNVATVSGSYTFSSSSLARNINSVYDPISDKFIIAYQTATSASINIVVGQVSGSTITFGSPTAVSSATTAQMHRNKSLDIDYNNGIFLLGYKRSYSGVYSHAAYVAGRVNGMQISLSNTITDSSVVNSGNISGNHNSPDGDSDFLSSVAIAYTGQSDYYTMWVSAYIISPSSNAAMMARIVRIDKNTTALSAMDIKVNTAATQVAGMPYVYYHGSGAEMDIASTYHDYQGSVENSNCLIVWKKEDQSQLYYAGIQVNGYYLELYSGGRQEFSNWSNTWTFVTPLSASTSDIAASKNAVYMISTGNKYAFVTISSGSNTNSVTSFQDFPAPSGFPGFEMSAVAAMAHKPGTDQLIALNYQSNNTYPDTHQKVYAIEYTYSNGALNPVGYIEVSDNSAHSLLSITYDGAQDKYVLTCSGDNTHKTFVYEPDNFSTNLTDSNFIGYSDASYSNGQTATVQVIGSVDDAQSGLTAGTQYYLQRDGSLDTVPDVPNIVAGTAIASNKILIKK